MKYKMQEMCKETKVKKGKKLQVFKIDLGLSEFYKYYINKYVVYYTGKRKRINKKDSFYINQKEFSEIIKEFNKKIRDLLVYEAFYFTLPCRMGKIAIEKIKPKIKEIDGRVKGAYPIDRGATKKLWDTDPQAKTLNKYVYHFNEHSDGYIAKFIYNKTKMNFTGKGQYFIKPTRTLKLMIKDVMMDPFKRHDYFISKSRINADR